LLSAGGFPPDQMRPPPACVVRVLTYIYPRVKVDTVNATLLLRLLPNPYHWT
jgi:hypothetical protein